MSIKNLGFFNYTGDSDLELPTVLGMGIQIPVKRINTNLIIDYNNDSFHGNIIRFGLKWSYSMFNLRMGTSQSENYSESSFGVGFTGNKWGTNLGVLRNTEQKLGWPIFIELVYYPKF